MKIHTRDFKEKIKEFGRDLDSKLTYESEGETIELGNEELNSITPHYEGDILKSVMKQLDIDSNVDIPIGTEINYQFGLKVGNSYEYLDYGNYIVFSSEKQEDTNSYRIIAYDKMLYSMKPYEALTDANDEPITYPITLRNYLIALARRLNLTFKNASDTFVNYDKEIKNELYLTEDGKSLDYTYRDVLDELSQATASSICISNDDELEVRYVNDTEGKNLLDIQKLTRNYLNPNCYYNIIDKNNIEVGANNANAWSGVSFNLSLPNGTYTISAKVKNDEDTNNMVYITPEEYDGSTRHAYWDLSWNANDRANGTKKSRTFTIDNSTYTYRLAFRVTSTANQTNYAFFENIQLELGTSVTDFEPYGDTIDEEYLKDVNVNFGEKFGKVNALVLSRSADSDIIDRRDETSIAQNGLCEIKISDNQILNDDDRDLFIDGIFNKLKGLEYYVNDYTSTGITYYDFLDKYNIKIGDQFYSCIMLNDEIEIAQGLIELIHSDSMKQEETDYTKSSKSDKMAIKTEIIVNKQQGRIDSIVGSVTTLQDDYGDLDSQVQLLGTRVTQTENGVQTAISKATNVEDTINNGVPKVVTSIVTIDFNGIDVGKSDSKVHTQMKNNEFSVGSKDSSIDDKLAFIGYDENEKMSKAQVDNMTIKHWLISGAHRRELFPVGLEERTGEFYNG